MSTFANNFNMRPYTLDNNPPLPFRRIKRIVERSLGAGGLSLLVHFSAQPGHFW